MTNYASNIHLMGMDKPFFAGIKITTTNDICRRMMNQGHIYRQSIHHCARLIDIFQWLVTSENTYRDYAYVESLVMNSQVY